jgi:hypothetical protein
VHGRVGSWLVGSTGEKIRSHRKWAGLIFLGLFVNWIMDNASSSQHIYVYLNKILQRIRKGLLSMYSYRDVLLVVWVQKGFTVVAKAAAEHANDLGGNDTCSR